jgi:hypothetical protein
MKRFVALVLLIFTVAAPVQALTPVQGVSLQIAQEEPAVVLDDSEGAPEETAWTFRFLVPTLMVLTVALVGGLIVWYQQGFNRRYRVRDAE